MAGRRQAVRVVRVAALALLLVVPLLLRGHRHVDHVAAAAPCAVCVAAHHSPAASAPPLALGAPPALALLVPAARVLVATADECHPQPCRAPPVRPPSHAA